MRTRPLPPSLSETRRRAARRLVAFWGLAIVVGACVPRPRFNATPSGLQYRVLAQGRGAEAHAGQRVSIHETTTLPSGGLIYTSRGGAPITFLLGGQQVIAGVDEGVTGMRVGERRVLIVPPALSRRTGYPANTPRDSTLHIDVELVAVLNDGR